MRGLEEKSEEAEWTGKVFGPESLQVDCLPHKETSRAECKLKDFTGVLGIHFS